MSTLTLSSPAKLNLFLHINRRRGEDEPFSGYHELQTVFQLLDYGDQLTFETHQEGDISIEPEVPGVQLTDNLIYKAAQALKTYAAKKNKVSNDQLGARIELEKVLPMGGGLGGGSSNAATTLLALNKLWNLQLSTEELMEIGAQLGADIPVFVHGVSAHAEGIGEELTPFPTQELWYVVLHPECHISTAKIFSHERLTRDTPKKRIAPAPEGQSNEPNIDFFSNDFRNDFEELASELYPEVNTCIQWLSKYGKARMTGTGACCFCPVKDKQTAEKVLNEARSKFKGFIAKGVQISPAIQRLNEA